MMLNDYQREFIVFLVKSGALSFGDFTLKSGRKAPYFVNTGSFDDGAKISALGGFYARHIIERKLLQDPIDRNVIFGPAYKGIPLCVATASALELRFQKNVGFAFDRKEAKDHGDGGLIVGKKIGRGDSIIIVEDVITAGTTLRKVVPMLTEDLKVKVGGVVIAVDRQERGESDVSALTEAEKQLGVRVYPLLQIREIINFLSAQNDSGVVLSSEQHSKAQKYLEQYGA